MKTLLRLGFLSSSLASVIVSQPVQLVTEVTTRTTYFCPTSTAVPVAPQASTSLYSGSGGNEAPSSTQNYTGPPSLQPTTYYDIDLTDVTNLVPCNTSQLYYTPSGVVDVNLEYQFALLTANHTYPAVVLEHTEYISDLHCIESGLSLSFNSSVAFSTAQNSWSTTFILVAHTSGCEVANSSDSRTFFLVANAEFDEGSLSVSLNITEIDINGAMTDFTIDYGTYIPTGNGTSNGTNSTSPAGGDSTSDLGCAAPPSSEIDGFPTAPCGSSFDTQLDDELAYLNFNTTDFSSSLESAAPGLGDFNVDDYQDDDIVGENNTAVERRTLGRRASTKTAPAKQQPAKQQPAKSSPVKTSPGKPQAPPPPPAPPKVATSGKSAAAPAVQQKVVAAVKKDNAAKPIAQTVKTQAPNGVSKTKNSANNAAAASKLAATLAKGLVKLATVGAELLKDPKFSESIDINLVPSSAPATSPFGDAVQLFKKEKTGDGPTEGAVGIYCIGCGVTGKLHFEGQLAFSLGPPKLTAATVSVNGNLQAIFNMGINADGSYKQTFEKDLASKAFRPFNIKGILALEPTISFSAELNMDVQSSGTIQTNASMSIPNFGATIDFVDATKSKAAGFQPVFNTSLDATGQITANSNVSLPIKIGAGLNIMNVTTIFVSLTNRPTMIAQSNYTYSAPDATCNNGVGYVFTLADTTALNLLDAVDIPLNEYTPAPSTQGCKQLGPGGTNTPAILSTTTDDTTGTGGSTLAGGAPGAAGIGTRSEKFDGKLKFKYSQLIPRDNSTSTTPSSASAIETPYSAPTDVVYDTADGDIAINEDSDFTSDEALAESDDSDADTPDEDGFTYSSIYDVSGQYILFNDDDGNFGLTTPDPSEVPFDFGSYENITVTDDDGRAMFYYPDVMTKYGVSRFRMNDYGHIPTTADFITLTPVNDDGSSATPGAYVAVDTSGNVFFTVLCLLQNQQAKIFLVNDLDTGVNTLTQGGLEYIVTGGVVTDCAPIEFVSDGAGL